MTARSGVALAKGTIVVACVLLLGFQSPSAPRRVRIPLVCSRGPSGQKHDVTITVPESVAPGSRYKVRVDGVDSGTVSHTGLRYIFDMWSEWPVPLGTEYVAGSARILPDTGSENVRPGARLVLSKRSINLVLSAHVDNGASYTAPSFEFELAVASPEGTSIAQRFSGYHVSANAFLVGDVRTSCQPNPEPFPVAVTRIESKP